MNQLLDRISLIKSRMGFSSDGAFADYLKINRSNFSQMMQGKRTIGDNVINKISVQTNINKDWIMTGKGEMMKKGSVPYSEYLNNTVASDIQQEYGLENISQEHRALLISINNLSQAMITNAQAMMINAEATKISAEASNKNSENMKELIELLKKDKK